MTTQLRRFSSLPSQVAALLDQELATGKWNGWLPSERSLTEHLQISRKTLRKALAQLRRDGVIEAVRRQGNRITGTRGRRAGGATLDSSVVLHTPDPLEQMRPYTLLWVNHLKTLLAENGIQWRSISGRKFFSQNPNRTLERLARQNPTSCWILANSNEATQAWFASNKIPCVIAGSCHSGVNLPFVDLDHYALCRHAAGVLLGAGHRRLALLHERSGRAGDKESEAGFIAGVRESKHHDAIAYSAAHEPSPEQLCKALGRLLDQDQPPTAILVSTPANYLTATSYLAQRRLRVPEDISIISRDDDPFLSALVPTPGRYQCAPHHYAKKMLRPVLHGVRNEEIEPRHTRLLPAYKRGQSVSTIKA